jgi:hypothetical protein
MARSSTPARARDSVEQSIHGLSFVASAGRAANFRALAA